MPPGKEFHDLRLPTAALSASGYRVEAVIFLSACPHKLPCMYSLILYPCHSKTQKHNRKTRFALTVMDMHKLQQKNNE